MRIETLRNVLLAICLGYLAPSLALSQPVITTPPTSQAVAAGGSATFTVAVSGPGPFTYQWRLNGTNLPAIITTVAGNGTEGYSGDGGPATSAFMTGPTGIGFDGLGNLFITDTYNGRIRKVAPNGIITTVAGNGTYGYSGDGGPATSAALTAPSGLAVDGFGNLFFADPGNSRIRKIAFSTGPTLVVAAAGFANAGNYDVVVRSASGSVTSSVAVLTVGQPFSLNATISSANNLILSLTGTAGQTYILQAATSLLAPINWQPVVTNAADASGNWRFTNATVSAQPAVFYRVALP
ncbi:MAG: hypothetical protein AAB676_12990 [Verrucomicrobiota bacterium]